MSESRLPPGPGAPPIIQGARFAFRPVGFFEECAARYGDAFTLRFPIGPPFVFFSVPEAVREILTGGADDLHGGEATQILRPIVGGQSILLLDGIRHERARRLMLPPFHGDRMIAYGEVMRAATAAVIARWPFARPFPVQREMQQITLDVILRAVFGVREGATMTILRDKLVRLIGASMNPMWLWPRLQIDLGRHSPWGRFVRVRREVYVLLTAEIARRREHGDGDAATDVLSLLVAARDEDGHAMCDEELLDEMMTLLLAGHETTATALSWTLYRILSDPAVLERVRAELATVAGGEGIRAEHVGRLEYLDATIKETLRLHPVIPDVGRMLQRPMRIGGWDLPAGVSVGPAIYLTHRRADVWQDPLTFDPQRFVGARPSPYEFLPFGGGVRRCLGMMFALFEMKVVLAEVLSRVELSLVPGYRVRLVRRSITFAPSEGMPVVVHKRAA